VASSEAAIGQVINIGSNYEISIGESAKLITDIMGVEIEIETDDKRLRPSKSEVDRLWADNTKAREFCEWKPEYGGLEGLRRGLTETIAWFTDPMNLRNYKWDVYNI